MQAAVEQRKPVYISIPSDFAAMQARQRLGKRLVTPWTHLECTAATQCNAGTPRHSCVHRPFHRRSPRSPDAVQHAAFAQAAPPPPPALVSVPSEWAFTLSCCFARKGGEA